MTDLLYKTLDRIETAANDARAASNDTKLGQAVLAERVGNLIEKTDEHIERDRLVHAAHSKDIERLNVWKTELKTKIATYAAIAGFFVSVVVSIGKEALAAVFN